jgi:diadenosine tetraphosphatase ApaH/serine/threonine PP2A family protein phosphatase
MPFSATINSNILCLHGGISPLLFKVSQLKKLERPYHEFSNKLINDILWSDPRNVIGFRNSYRGMGCYFGETSLKKFLINNHLDLLVRGHECVYECKYTHGNKCLTVFSASNYCGESGNKSSALVVHSSKERKILNFEPIKYLKRSEVILKKEGNHNVRSLSSASSMSKIILSPNGKLKRENSSKKLSLLLQG